MYLPAGQSRDSPAVVFYNILLFVFDRYIFAETKPKK